LARKAVDHTGVFPTLRPRLVSVSKRGIKFRTASVAKLLFQQEELPMSFGNEPFDTDVPMQTPKQKPIHEVRLGSIKAAVWKNETENGTRYNVTFSRIYKDGDNWKSTDSFGRDDLLTVGKVADLAHSWIFAQSQSQEEEKANNHRR
jgi:hypothetical protein